MRALAFLLLLLLAQPAAASPPVLRVCMTDLPHAPWRLPEADGLVREQGLDFALLRDFERLSGWKVELRLRPGRRCLLELQEGDSDATVGLSHTAERARWARFPVRDGQLDERLALRVDGYSLYALNPDGLRWDGERLRLRDGAPPVAVQGGHSVGPWLREQGIAVDERARNVAQALRLVEDGSLELAALMRSEADAHLALAPSKLRRIEPPLLMKPYFVVFSEPFAQRHEPQLAQLWQDFAKAARAPAYQRAAQAARRR